MQHPRAIAKKVFKFMLRNESEFMAKLKTEKGEQVFSSILENLVSHSEECHFISKSFLEMIMDQTNLDLHEILYGGDSWSDICDSGTSDLTRTQSKFPFNYFQSKDLRSFPLVNLMRNLIRVINVINP